jgi:dTDP-4-amino-4,6-dideoxygalactose transaminase
MRIPFHKPFYDAADEQAIINAFRSARLVGDGPMTAQATARLQELLGVPHVLLTTSCSHALELAMMVLDLRPGDEVIVPSFTFVSTTNCIMRQGARPVFADILPRQLTIDPLDVRRRLTSATRAIIPVGYAGISPEMDDLRALASEHGISIVEDAAQSVGATYHGRPQGTTGDIGCLSFHETKNVSTGEGGALFTSRADMAARAEIIREKGTNRKQFLLGLVDKYTWVDVGSSFLPPDHTAALLLSQLAKLDVITARRRAIHERYMEGLTPLAVAGRLTLPVIPGHSGSNYHLFHVLMEDEGTRNAAIAFFRERGIATTFHYLPLHLSPVGATLGYGPGEFPVTESVSARLLRLPIYPGLTEEEQSAVIATMTGFLR